MENKTSKYIKYALGEIMLVVTGILITLQITWNQDLTRAVRKAEARFGSALRYI